MIDLLASVRALVVRRYPLRRWRLLIDAQFCQGTGHFQGCPSLERKVPSPPRNSRDGEASTKPSSFDGVGLVEAARSWGGHCSRSPEPNRVTTKCSIQFQSKVICFKKTRHQRRHRSSLFRTATIAENAPSLHPCIHFVHRKFHFGIGKFSTANNRTVPEARFRHVGSRLLLIVGRVLEQRQPRIDNSQLALL